MASKENNDVDNMEEDDGEPYAVEDDQASALTQNMIPHDDEIVAAVARQYNMDPELIYGDKALRHQEEDD